MRAGILDEISVKSFAGLTDENLLKSADIVLGVALDKNRDIDGLEDTERKDDIAAGIMAVKLNGTDADVLDFFVAPDYREMGAGEELLRTWNEIAYNAGIDSVVFSFDRDKNELLDEFLENQDVRLSDGLEVEYSFTLKDISEDAVKASDSDAEIVSLLDISEEDYQHISILLGNVALKDKSSFDYDLSFVAKNKKKITAAILVSKTGNVCTIEAMVVEDKAYVKDLMMIVSKCAAKLSEVCDQDTKIFARAINENAAAFINKITDEKAVEESHIVTRYIVY